MAKLEIRSMPCSHKEHRIPINKKQAKGHAKITDYTSVYSVINELQEHTAWVEFSYDKNNHSLDIFFKRDNFEWDSGAGIQINKLNKQDKEALRQYLESGK